MLKYLDTMPMLRSQFNAVLEVLGTTPKPEGDQDKTGDLKEMVKALVQKAIDEFGFAPRDVFGGIFTLAKTRKEHENAQFTPNLSTLKIVAPSFSSELKLDSPLDLIFAVYPKPSRFLCGPDQWTVDFKSAQIRKAMEEMKSPGKPTDVGRPQQKRSLPPHSRPVSVIPLAFGFAN